MCGENRILYGVDGFKRTIQLGLRTGYFKVGMKFTITVIILCS